MSDTPKEFRQLTKDFYIEVDKIILSGRFEMVKDPDYENKTLIIFEDEYLCTWQKTGSKEDLINETEKRTESSETEQ